MILGLSTLRRPCCRTYLPSLGSPMRPCCDVMFASLSPTAGRFGKGIRSRMGSGFGAISIVEVGACLLR
jgi:hypothetical protein